MRVPGIHVLLTAGIVAVTSIGTVAAFSLTGSSEAEQRLPAVAPPQPAAPAPAVEQETTAAEPTRDAAPESDRSSDDGDRRTRERAPDPPKDKGDDKPGRSTVKPDPDGTDQEKLAYACQAGFLHGDICKRYT